MGFFISFPSSPFEPSRMTLTARSYTMFCLDLSHVPQASEKNGYVPFKTLYRYISPDIDQSGCLLAYISCSTPCFQLSMPGSYCLYSLLCPAPYQTICCCGPEIQIDFSLPNTPVEGLVQERSLINNCCIKLTKGLTK